MSRKVLFLPLLLGLFFPLFGESFGLRQDFSVSTSVATETSIEFSSFADFNFNKNYLEFGFRSDLASSDLSLKFRHVFFDTTVHLHLITQGEWTVDWSANACIEPGFVKGRFYMNFPISLGVQLTTSFMKELRQGLFSMAPSFAFATNFGLIDKFHMSLSVCSNTLFDWSFQSMSPIIGADISLNLSKDLLLGVYTTIKLTDFPIENLFVNQARAGVSLHWREK